MARSVAAPPAILRTFVTDPARIIATVFQPKKILFLFGIFGPVAGLSWVSGWAALVLLPTLGYLLLSSYEPQFSFTSQYSAPLVPLVIGTAILGLASGSDPVPTCAGSSHGGELARFE